MNANRKKYIYIKDRSCGMSISNLKEKFNSPLQVFVYIHIHFLTVVMVTLSNTHLGSKSVLFHYSFKTVCTCLAKKKKVLAQKIYDKLLVYFSNC